MRDRSVLLVHPEGLAGRQLAQTIEEEGFSCVLVPDGERAIDRFIQEPFDILIAEMVLPGRDGATTAESIRWAPGGERVAVVLLASRGGGKNELASAAERVNADETFSGPNTEADVRQFLAKLGPSPEPRRLQDSAEWLHLSSTVPGKMAKLPDASDQPTAIDELAANWVRGDDPLFELEGEAVEQHAALAKRSTNALEGNFRNSPFAELLCQLWRMNATGALIATSETDSRRTTSGETPKKAVFFEDGIPAYVQSNLVQECLGRVLARAGRISKSVMEESVERMRNGSRQGAVLLQMEAITARELQDALRDQLRVKIFDLFAWEAGDYRFSTKMVPPAETVALDMTIPELVIEGVVHRVVPTRLLGLMSPYLDHYVLPRPSVMKQFSGLRMAREARRTVSVPSRL
ncbi:MAG: DUF4388 domain-containing protein [Myxococcota bacterium]